MRYLLLFASVLLLAACAGQRTQLNGDLRVQPAWFSAGKIALHDGDRHTTLRFSWRQHYDDYQLTLNGSFGLGALTITKKKGLIRLWKGRISSAQQRLIAPLDSADSAEQLLETHTGLRFPLSLLRYWATGQPAPGHAYRTLTSATDTNTATETGLRNFQQAGWHIQYVRAFDTDDQRASLPKKMRIEKREQRIIIAFSNWSVTSTDHAHAHAHAHE